MSENPRIGLKLLAAISLCIVSGCDQTPWRGWIYPDKTDLTHSIEIGPYKSLDECRSGVRRATADMIDPTSWDYECGLKCKSDKPLGVNVCKETVR